MAKITALTLQTDAVDAGKQVCEVVKLLVDPVQVFVVSSGVKVCRQDAAVASD